MIFATIVARAVAVVILGAFTWGVISLLWNAARQLDQED